MSIPPKVLSSTKTKTLFLCFHEIQIRHHDITKNLVFAVILACNVERTTSLSLTPFHNISHWPQIGSKDHQHLSHNADIYSWTTLGSLLHITQFLIWHRIGLKVFVQLPALDTQLSEPGSYYSLSKSQPENRNVVKTNCGTFKTLMA